MKVIDRFEYREGMEYDEVLDFFSRYLPYWKACFRCFEVVCGLTRPDWIVLGPGEEDSEKDSEKCNGVGFTAIHIDEYPDDFPVAELMEKLA